MPSQKKTGGPTFLVGDPAYADTLKKMQVRCDELRDSLGGEYSLENIPTVKYLKEKQQAGKNQKK